MKGHRTGRGFFILVFSAMCMCALSCHKRTPENAIAFVSDRAGNQDIYLFDLDADTALALTDDEGEDWAPDWSPDGEKLAFASNRDGDWNIYIMTLKNRKVRRVTKTGQDRRPSWSPDGDNIAFVTERDGNDEIYTMNLDGAESKNVTNHPARDDRPVWSPNGDHIAFCSNRDGDWEIYILHVEGGDAEKLTDNTVPDFPGCWSGDGKSLLFTSEDNIVLYSFANGTMTNLSKDDFKRGTPGFSPNGELIVFESDQSGDYDIWFMHRDGTGLSNMTQHPAFDWFPKWRPLR